MNKNWQKFDNLMIDNKDILNSINVKQIANGDFAVWLRELKQVLCDNLDR